MTFLRTTALAGLAALAFSSAAMATVVYSDDASNFNGAYNSVGTVDYTFNATAGSSTISFDLFGANSIDGYGNSYDDLFSIALNGVTVFEGYFNMSGGGDNLVITNTLGWAFDTMTNPGGNFMGGITSVSGLADLVAGMNTFSVTFTAEGPSNGGNQGTNDESWALNNLDIGASPVPLPAGLPLLAAALGGLGLIRRARKSAR